MFFPKFIEFRAEKGWNCEYLALSVSKLRNEVITIFAVQYVTRPGNGYGGYVVHDDKGLVFIPATSASDIAPLYKWIGNGDMVKGRNAMDDAFSMPSVSLNPAQYNSMVNQLVKHTTRSFVKEG